MSDFIRYRIRETTIDGPPLDPGTEVGLRVLARVEPGVPADDGAGLRLRIDDWAGPWPEVHDPGANPDPIPEHVLNAVAAAAIRRLLEGDLPFAAITSSSDARAVPAAYDEVGRAVAQAVLEQVGRMLRPTDDEATALIVGVRELDLAKLARAGDALAAEVVDRTAHNGLKDRRDEWRRLREIYGPKEGGS